MRPKTQGMNRRHDNKKSAQLHYSTFRNKINDHYEPTRPRNIFNNLWATQKVAKSSREAANAFSTIQPKSSDKNVARGSAAKALRDMSLKNSLTGVITRTKKSDLFPQPESSAIKKERYIQYLTEH